MSSASHDVATAAEAIDWTNCRDKSAAAHVLSLLPPVTRYQARYMYGSPMARAVCGDLGHAVIYKTRVTLDGEGLAAWAVANLPAGELAQRLRVTDTGLHQLVFDPRDSATPTRSGGSTASVGPVSPPNVSACCQMELSATGLCGSCGEPA